MIAEKHKTIFEKELATLLNKYGIENGSDTPDFILAEYLVDCLQTFNLVMRLRSNWYGEKKDNNTTIPLKGK